MVKRVFSALLLIYMGMYFVFSPVMLYAASTNGSASPWTREKAEHLARKALIGATPTIIDTLFQAGSASAAVNILFPDTVGPSRTSYDAEVTALTSSGFNFGNEGNMRKLYQLRYYRDPYEAKVKLLSLFEDIFPANQSDVISYLDIKNQHDLLYSNILGSYKTLVKKILFNNGQVGDYAEGKFLDLLDGSNKNYPNENYARELLQLFLMGEYKPGESKELWSTRNYEESDVAAAAKILTGLRSDPTTHIVSYDASFHNTSTGVLFLSGTLSSNPFSSFYNAASGTLDLGAMQTPLMGNNGLTDNTIDYIFAQRGEAISLFLADRLFRFYVHGNPSRSELDTIAANIRSNDFDIFPSVKALLSSDVLYSDASMNAISFKNPLELAIGTLKVLHDKDPSTLDPRIYDTELLNMLNWRPYFPGSVFGREGFDDNAKWFTAYTENQWISFSTKLASTVATGSYLLSNIVSTSPITLSGSFPVTTSSLNTYTGSISFQGTGTILLSSGTESSSWVSFDYTTGSISLPSFLVRLGSWVLTIDQGTLDLTNNLLTVSSGSMVYSGSTYSDFSGSFSLAPGMSLSSESSIDTVIEQIEKNVLHSRVLPEAVKAKIKTYATTTSTGLTVPFIPSNTTTQASKIRGIIALALASPEFILQTGHDVSPVTENPAPSPISSTSNKIVFIELPGGYDWLHGVIQKDQYSTYQSLRTNGSGTIAIAPQNLTDLGDFYMNNALAFSGANGPSLKSLYDSNNLRIFNRVGTFKHSRDHDAAQKQSTSYSNTTEYEDDGAFGHIIKREAEASNTISLSGKRPNVFRNGNFINIGPSGAVFTNYAPISTPEKTSQLNLFRDVFANRTYPGSAAWVFKDAAKIDEVAALSVQRSGPSGAGYGNVNNFAFLRSLLWANVGKAFFVQGDGGYDTHSNQLAPASNFDPNNIPRDLNYNVGRVMSNATAFFNSVKDTQNITIVIYSEFGRTIRVNGDLGTDHGEGGGMFVISNNPTLQSNLPNKVYGGMDLLHEKSDWLGVGIDYRSVYGKIYNALYGLSDSSYFTSTNRLEDNMDINPPKFALARNEFRSGYNSANARLVIPFRIEDTNFSMDYGSNLEIEYGTGFTSLKKLNQWSVDNYVRKPDGTYLFDVGVFSKNTPYVYRIRAVDNQLRQTVLTGSLNIPDIRTPSNSTGSIMSNVADTIFYAHNNTNISGTLSLTGRTSITLANNGTGATSTVIARDGVSMIMGTGTTRVDSIASSSGTINWNGGFILGESIPKESFLSSLSLAGTGVPLTSMNVEKIIKVGADTLGVQMNLNKPVTINVAWVISPSAYTILRSEDWLRWNSIGTWAVSSGVLSFQSTSFSYFALVSANAVPVACVPGTISWVQSAPITAMTVGLCPVGQSVGNFTATPSGSTTNYVWTCNGSTGVNCSASYTASSGGGWGGWGGGWGGWGWGGGSYYYPPVTSTATGTSTSSSSGGLFASNPVISGYAFPGNEKIPGKVLAELNFIVTKITKALDKVVGSDENKKKRYYRAFDAYILSRMAKASNDREKRILEYLHGRLIIVSKWILSSSVVTPTPVSASTSMVAPTPATPAINLSLDFKNPVLLAYDFTQDKRFPKTVTTVLDSMSDGISSRILSKNISSAAKKSLYNELIATLDTALKTKTDIREQKILQYIRNRLYREWQNLGMNE